MLRSKIKGKLFEFIRDYFIKESGTALDDDTLLVEKGIIDSTGVIELVCFIEETFNIKVDDSEIISENFDSINQLVNYIQPKSEKKASK